MKKIFSVILVLAMLISLSAGLAIMASAGTISDPWDGSTTTAVSETAEDGSVGSGYYRVGTGEELAWVATQVNAGVNMFSDKTVILTGDINLGTENQWTPIGNATSFAGTFDGGGKTISGLYISNNANTNEGLFGYVNGGTIENLTVRGTISVTSAGQRRAGGIAGYFNNGTLTNCVNDVAISVLISSSDNLEHDFGGVAGYVYNSTVQGCSNTGTITVNTYGSPYNYTGGVIGYAANSNIYDCENSGNVSMTSDYFFGEVYAGGIAGRVANQTCARSCLNSGAVYVYAHTALYTGGIFAVVNAGCELYNCLNTGSILVVGPEALASAACFAGGVAGILLGYSMGSTAENCVNTGSVTNPASNNTGGVIGNSSGTTTSIGYCYWGGNCTQTTACGTAESEPYDCYAFDGSLDFGTDDSVTLGGRSYTVALAALRAWVNMENAQAGDIIYRTWTGTSSSDIAFGTAVNVSYDLTNVSKTGNDFAVENEDYETTLSTETGYPADVSVTVNAVAAGESDYSYNDTTGELTVFAAAVTGDIRITASSTETLYYDVNIDLTGMSVATGQVGENAAVSAQQYSVTLAADDGYILSDDVTVTVNAGGDSGLETLTAGVDYSFSSDTGILTVYADSVTGDMTITASGIAVYDVDVSGLTDITASDNTGENAAIAGEDYTITLTAVFPKSVPEEIIVWVDTNGNGTQDEGEVLPDTNYSWTDVLGGELTISGGYVTGDIYITAQAVTDLPQLVVIGGVVLYSTDTESNPINNLVDNDGNSVYTLDCDTAFTVDDFAGSGTAVYDSATGTLTLNGVSVPFTYLPYNSGVHYYIDDYDYDYYLDGDGLFVGGGNLTLALNGDNVFGVAGTENTVDDFNISGGAVAVTDGTDAGTGSLTIYGYTSEDDSVCGLNASRNIYFEDVDYNFIGDAADAEYCCGMDAWGDFYMYSGSIDVEVTGGSYGGEFVGARSFYMYGGSMDISGTSSSNAFGIMIENVITVSGGEINVSLATTEDGYGVCAWNGINITGGSINIEMENLTVSAQRDMVQAAGISTNFSQTGIYSGGDLIISGGTVSTVAHGNYARGIYMDGEGTGNVMISGGMLSATGDTYAISANSVTYDGENDILSNTTPRILAAATAEGTVSDLSTVIFDGKDGMYYVPDWIALTYVKIGTPSNSGGVLYYYTVTADAGAGGSITPTSKSATKFTMVPFTITPDEGYAIASLTVGGAAVALTALTDNGDGTFGYSLKVTGDTALKVTFSAAQTTGPAYEGYADRNAWSWASGDIAFVIENGLMGSTDTDGMTFDAWSGVTRGMTVTILYRMAGSPALTAGDYETYNAQFADVASGAWYYDAVVWATNNNVTEGISDTMFAPDQDVSREQLVTLMFRFAGSMGYDVGLSDELGSYTDAGEIDTWAVNSFSWAVAADIVNGTSASTLSPISGATRAELATIIAGFISAFMADGNWAEV